MDKREVSDMAHEFLSCEIPTLEQLEKYQKSLAEKAGTLDFDKGPKYPSLHPPILKV